MKFLGRKVKLPKRPGSSRRRTPQRRSSGPAYTPRPLFSRAKPSFYRPKPKPPEYETQTEVVMYQRKPLKTFKGPTSKDEAKLLVSQMKEKDPNSRYVVKSKKVPKKGWF